MGHSSSFYGYRVNHVRLLIILLSANSGEH